MKILVMKFRNIGDVLLVTPLLANLKLHYPDAEIDVAVNKGTEAMVEGHSAVHKVVIYDRAKIKGLSLLRRLKAEWSFAMQIRKRSYDLVINTTEGDRGAQLAWLSGAETCVGYRPKKNKLLQNTFIHTLPKQGLRHTIEMNLDPVRALGLMVKTKKVEIVFSEEDERFVDQILETQNVNAGEFMHVHPVSRWQFKCIADQTMATTIDFIELTLKKKVILTAASERVEGDKIQAILNLCQSTPINLAGQLTLKQTAALNKRALAFVGVDTAIMHISAANDTPVLAFFGPSGADHWGPWDNDLTESGYVGRRGLRAMGKHRVIQENRPCVPCGQDGCNNSKVSDCLMQLDQGVIEKKIREMIDG